MRQTAHDSLREIVSHVSTDNPTAAEKLGSELLDQALSLESLPFRGSQVRKRPGYLKLVHGNYLITTGSKDQRRREGCRSTPVCSRREDSLRDDRDNISG